MEMTAFLAKHPVFTYDEFTGFLQSRGSTNRKTRDNLLSYHIREGHVIRVTRGLFASVPPATDREHAPVDVYLLASKMSEDAVLAYHTALEFYGKAHSVHERFLYLTGHRRKTSSINFRGNEFRGVLFPKALRDKGQELFGVRNADRTGMSLRVTTLERTLVDVMDRPEFGGGWEEIWRSLESVEFFEIDQVVHYTLLLENSTTAAKVGFYLESHQQELMVDDADLDHIRRHSPKQPTYMARQTKGRLVKAWNLVVPSRVLDRSWEEIP
jgi:predicted transcriptional regulator of viral defense system